MMSISSVEVLGSALHKQSNNQTKKAQDGTEDLNNKNLDETTGMSVTGFKV